MRERVARAGKVAAVLVDPFARTVRSLDVPAGRVEGTLVPTLSSEERDALLLAREMRAMLGPGRPARFERVRAAEPSGQFVLMCEHVAHDGPDITHAPGFRVTPHAAPVRSRSIFVGMMMMPSGAAMPFCVDLDPETVASIVEFVDPPADAERALCVRCGEARARGRCVGCHAARYCGEACYLADWPEHRAACKRP